MFQVATFTHSGGLIRSELEGAKWGTRHTLNGQDRTLNHGPGSPGSALPLPRLHILTNDAILRRADIFDLATAILQSLGSSVALHIRARDVAAAEIFHLANALRAAAPASLLVLNDRLDIALAAPTRAVHLNRRGLPIPAARRLAPDFLIGYSAHERAEARSAQDHGADFLFAGTIFPSTSHPGVPAGGIDLFRQITVSCDVPVLAIGGIRPERVEELRAAGAYGVAVISAVWEAKDPVHAAAEFARILES